MPGTNHLNCNIGGKWTTTSPTLGWIHFRIIRRFRTKGELWVELAAACDVAACFVLAADELKDRKRFKQGWVGPEDARSKSKGD